MTLANPMQCASGQKSNSLLSSYTANLGQLVARRRAEAALRAAAMESALANRAKSEFLANMSHELRTPLNAIIGFSELITLAPTKRAAGKSRAYASHITQAGRHLLNIVNDILNISHLESGRLRLDLEPLELRSVVASAILLAQHRIEQKEQTVDVELPKHLPPVFADELRLKQVLINLLSNASKFTPRGGRLKVTAVRSSQSKHISVALSDTGIGMTQEEVERALQPFARIRSTYTRNEEGTGLGLPIARALILKHGGTLDILSTPGVGTTVTFTIPIAAGGLRACERSDVEHPL
jgi:two-component system cell cycle sensor histidine kinase PleC